MFPQSKPSTCKEPLPRQQLNLYEQRDARDKPRAMLLRLQGNSPSPQHYTLISLLCGKAIISQQKRICQYNFSKSQREKELPNTNLPKMRRACLLPSLFSFWNIRQFPTKKLLTVLIFLFGLALAVGFVFGLVFVFVLVLIFGLVLIAVFHCVFLF